LVRGGESGSALYLNGQNTKCSAQRRFFLAATDKRARKRAHEGPTAWTPVSVEAKNFPSIRKNQETRPDPAKKGKIKFHQAGTAVLSHRISWGGAESSANSDDFFPQQDIASLLDTWRSLKRCGGSLRKNTVWGRGAACGASLHLE
jgi:hypothetical protein